MRSVPYSCDRCREAGSPTGILVFPPAPPPDCKYHLTPMTRSPFYDEAGNRIARPTPTEDE